MPEVTQVQELIVPLRNNPQTVLDEGDNDQETTNGGQITRTQRNQHSALNHNHLARPARKWLAAPNREPPFRDETKQNKHTA